MRLARGSKRAKLQMGALRDRKRFLRKQVLIAQWALLAKRSQSDWWPASGLAYGCGQEASIAWLKTEISKMEGK